MFKVEVFDMTRVWVTCLCTAGGLIPQERMTRKDARAYLAARRAECPDEKLRIVRLQPPASRQLTPKRYACEMRKHIGNTRTEWELMGHKPSKRQAARDYIAGSMAYDKRHGITGWKYRVVEVVSA